MNRDLHDAADALGQAARDFARIACLAALLGLITLALTAGVFLTGPCRVGLCTDGRAEKNGPHPVGRSTEVGAEKSGPLPGRAPHGRRGQKNTKLFTERLLP